MRTLFSLLLVGLSPAVHSQDTAMLRQIKKVENSLVPAVQIEGQPETLYNLQVRMQHYNIPAVSIAFINNGRIAWAKAYGYLDRSQQVKTDTLTLFQGSLH